MVEKRNNGSGSIIQRGPSTWLVRVANGRRRDGSIRRVSKTVHGSREDAECAARELSGEMDVLKNLGEHLTLDGYFYGQFSTVHAPLLANATWSRYKSVWANHISPAFGDLNPADVKRANVQVWAAGLSPAMAHEAYKVLKTVLRRAWADELIDKEPLRRGVTLPQRQAQMVDAWEPTEVLAAMDRLKGNRIEPLWLAIVGAGLRREEALALRTPDDLTFEQVTSMDGSEIWVCRINVDKALTREDGLKGTKTHRTRVVSVSEPFAGRLHEVCAGMGPGPLMRNIDGSPMKPGSVSRHWSRLFQGNGPLVGMRYVKLYTGRHSHETAASRAGVPDSLNSRVHGHSRLVEYSHYLVRSQTDADIAAQAVSEHFAKHAS